MDTQTVILRNNNTDEKASVSQTPEQVPIKVKKRKFKSSNMVSIENELLFMLVARNFREFNSKTVPGKKGGKTMRQILVERWSEQVTSLGISRRSPEQIQEKVRKAIERCRKCIAIEKELATSPLSTVDHQSLTDLPYYLTPLKEALLAKQDENSSFAEESGDSLFGELEMPKPLQSSRGSSLAGDSTFHTSYMPNSAEAVSPTSATSSNRTETPTKVEEVHVSAITSLLAGPIVSQPKEVTKNDSNEKDTSADAELRRSLIEAEIRAAEMKKAYYAKKIELVDAQLELTLSQIKMQRKGTSPDIR